MRKASRSANQTADGASTRLEGADLIVCGAYGHTRLGEWVFGGATADLLSQDQVYLLLSH